MIVVDASVVVTALSDDGRYGDVARARLSDQDLHAPALIDIEVLSAFRSAVAGGSVTESRSRQAVEDLRDLPFPRVDHGGLLDRCWELRHNLTPYDAAYVALAEFTDSLLLTADARLAKAPGIRCEVEVLRAPPEPVKPVSQ